MTPTPNNLAHLSPLHTEKIMETIPTISISRALSILKELKENISNPELLTLIKSLEAKCLILEGSWVNYVSGALEIMLSELTSREIPLAQAIRILTGKHSDRKKHSAANDEHYTIAA